MKAIFIPIFIFVFLYFNSVYAVINDENVNIQDSIISTEDVQQCMDEGFELEDCIPMNSLAGDDKINEIKPDFNMKSFNSCESLEKVIGKYIKDYWKNNKNRWNYPVMLKTMRSEPGIMATDDLVVNESMSEGLVTEQYSKTNTQVNGVDESDIIKTDGEYIYYFNKEDKNIYIITSKSLEIIKKIKLPKNFNNTVLYIDKNRLTVLSTAYSNKNYLGRYFIDRNTKTYVIVFDTTNIKRPILTKLYVSDGSLQKSRKIGNNIYVLTNNYFNIPYRNYKNIYDIVLNTNKILPKKIDISKVTDELKQNLQLKGKKLPYNITTGNIADCSDIEYVLPDSATIKNFDFTPSYNIISIIDTLDTSKPVKTKVIAGSNAEIYMSNDSLYLTTHMYSNNNFKCAPGFNCIALWYPRGENTLVHRLSVDGQELSYKNSNIIPGSPLNQYSMDQYGDNFRIITSTNYPERSTALYILEKDGLKIHSKLENIEPGEQFKSSRFIGDKLFLVTFKQVDPLFVIDLENTKNPKIIGELKIPGYSTYLHPYDEKHLIGLGYNTSENKWGGTINDGLKIDLYEINYNKKCGDTNLTLQEQKKCSSGDYKGIIVKQKYSKTYGENGSYSEALTNPRMFMWKGLEKKLFLPMTLYKNDKNDMYKKTDFFQGLVVSTIDTNKGILENFRITHIDSSNIVNDRKKECIKYSSNKKEEVICKKIIGGGEYCEPKKRQSYVPRYCYADSTIGEYIASKSWNYRKSYVNRALWIGQKTYSISDDMIKQTDIKTGRINKTQKLLK